MENCSNLCTAEKCAELEKQISDLTLELLALKIQLETLKIDLANHLTLDIPNAHKYNPQLNFSLNIENGWLYGDVYLDSTNASAQVQLPTPEVLVDVLDTGDNNFTIKVGVDGESDEDTFSINIPENEPPNVLIDVLDTGENNFTIKVEVDGQFDEDNFSVTIPEVETDTHVKSDLKGSGSFRDDTLTITIADGESSDTFQVSIPITDLTSTTFITERVYMNCDELEQLIINLENNLTNQLTNIANAVVIDINGEIDSEFECVEEPDNQNPGQVNKVAQFQPVEYAGLGLVGLHQFLTIANTNLTSIYEGICVENEPTEVVSLVAADRFVTQASGKILVLHFVTFDNYPKRSRDSSYRQVQIPSPKETFIWEEDFENLRWWQGNQYAELRFNENYVPVSGWFKDEEQANAYFDAVLELTTATESNRVIPKHSNPKTSIPEQETRPYRAFIESINAEGRAVCEVKYTPPSNSNGQ